jgi:formylglycine-generating enzyme required for sulfatase activity
LWRLRARPSAGQTAREQETNAASKAPLPQVANSIGMELVYISPGSFVMGSENGDDDEKPVHHVTITEGFYIGKYEVTNAQWWTVMKTGVPSFNSNVNPAANSNFNPQNKHLEKFPAKDISWDDAQRFISKLNELNDGYKYRLPSEAEWEYACRAGTGGDYAGSLDEMAWYRANSDNDYPTHWVGQKQPNAFWLYDMHGNVWEWCQDNYHTNYTGAPTNGSAWQGGGGASLRVMRGGSQRDSASNLRSARRRQDSHDARNYNNLYGFRVVAVMRQ